MYRKKKQPEPVPVIKKSPSVVAPLKSVRIQAPATTPTVAAQKKATKTTTPAKQRHTGFCFDDDDVDSENEPPERTRNARPLDSSQLLSEEDQEMPAAQRRDVTDIYEQELEESENQNDPRMLVESREAFRCQTQCLTQAPAPDPLFEPQVPTDGMFTGPFFDRLRKLKILVMEDDDESFLSLGPMSHSELMTKIENEWGRDLSTVVNVINELNTQIAGRNALWKLFLSPTRNICGTQDSIIRALVLSNIFQQAIFQLIFQKLNVIAKNKDADEESIGIGELIIVQLRFVTEVANPKTMFVMISDKKLDSWTPKLRDEFVTMLPELLTDSEVHTDAIKMLCDLIVLRGLKSPETLHKSALLAIQCFDTDTNQNDKTRMFLMRSLMIFNPANVQLAVKTVLMILKKSNVDGFKNFLVNLRKFLDISKLKRLELNDSFVESEMTLDQSLANLFRWVTEFMRMDVSKYQGSLLKFFADSKMSRRAVHVSISAASGSEESQEEMADVADPDYVDDEDEGSEVGVEELQREFDLIDVFLLFCLNEAKKGSVMVLKELRNQLAVSHDNFISLKMLFVEAMSFPEFGRTFFHSSLLLARDLLSSFNLQLNSLGSIIYKQLFINQEDKEGVLQSIVSHFGATDSAAEGALTILEDIINEDVKLLRPFLPQINELIDVLNYLSAGNVRRILFIIISLNMYSEASDGQATQCRRTGLTAKFLRRFEIYLTSSDYRETSFGVVGLVQYVKALLLFRDDVSHHVENAEEQISNYLKKVDEKTAQKGQGRARATFLFELHQLLKNMDKLGESKALMSFGSKFIKSTRKTFYSNVEDDTHSPGQFDNEEYLDAATLLQIDLVDLTSDGNAFVNGNVRYLVPAMQLVKSFALYKSLFQQNDSDSVVEESHWKTSLFILEANVNLSRLSTEDSQFDRQKKCNILYAAVEYIRTVLNLFGDYQTDDPKVEQWMKTKLNLMIFCQQQMTSIIKKLETFTLPKLSTVNLEALIVKYKDPTKKAPRPPRKSKDKSKSTSSNQQPFNDGFVDDPDVSNPVVIDPDVTEPEPHNAGTMEAEMDETGEMASYKMRKYATPKSISVDQLQWYLTPLSLAAITQLIKITGMKRKQTGMLVEIFHVILKHIMPAADKVMPAGFGFVSASPMASMDFGDKETRWKLISSAIPSIFKILHQTLNIFTQNTEQNEPNISSDNMVEMCKLLNFCVMIFSRIFQSKEIATDPSPKDSNAPLTLTRRAHILSAMGKEINLVNTSMEPINPDNRLSRSANNSNDVTAERMSRLSTRNETRPANDVSDSVSNADDEIIIDFFIRVAEYVPTMESAAALLALLKTFSNLTEYHKRKLAQKALFFLRKEWKNGDEVVTDDKSALQLASDYLHFRPESEHISAIAWLVCHQVAKLYNEDELAAMGSNLDIKDDEEYVGNYKEVLFPCFTKKSFATWFKFLFKHINDNIISYLKEANKALDKKSKHFQLLWYNALEACFVLSFAAKCKQFKTITMMMTLAKEARRFLCYVISPKSSFSKILGNKELLISSGDFSKTVIAKIQGINGNLNSLRDYAIKKKPPALLKLLPDLQAAREKMLRSALICGGQSGINNSIMIGYRKNQYDRNSKDDQPPSKKKKQTPLGAEGDSLVESPAQRKKKNNNDTTGSTVVEETGKRKRKKKNDPPAAGASSKKKQKKTSTVQPSMTIIKMEADTSIVEA